MKQLLDTIKNSLINEFDIDTNGGDLSLRLVEISNNPSNMDAGKKLISDALKSRLQYEELLRFIGEINEREQIEDWLLSILKSKKDELLSRLPNTVDDDLESIVSVSQSEPKVEESISSPESGEASSTPAINDKVKMHLDGQLRFTDLQRGFEVELINDGEAEFILRKTDSDFLAVSSRLLDKDYLMQIAEIIVKNAGENPEFTIHLPLSLSKRTPKEQKFYASTMQEALIKAGAPKNAIRNPFESEPTQDNDNSVSKEDNSPSKEEREFIDKYTGTNIKNRFFQYLDRDKKSPSRNPWINFETLCKKEGARVIAGMLNDGFAWSPNATVSEKIFAINKYIDNTMAKNPDDYFGVIAIESDDGGIAFKPDTKPFAMSHVYEIDATPNQLNMIKRLGFGDDLIDKLVADLDSFVEEKKKTAADSIKQTYESEAGGQQHEDLNQHTHSFDASDNQNYDFDSMTDDDRYEAEQQWRDSFDAPPDSMFVDNTAQQATSQVKPRSDSNDRPKQPSPKIGI